MVFALHNAVGAPVACGETYLPSKFEQVRVMVRNLLIFSIICSIFLCTGCLRFLSCPLGSKLVEEAPPANTQYCLKRDRHGNLMREGRFTQWDSKTGTMVIRGQFRKNQMDGVWQRFTPTGNLKMEMHYKWGKLHGDFKLWYPKGTVQLVARYQSGQLVGERTLFHENGVLAEKSFFRDGKLHGVKITWLENGDKASEELFEGGKKIEDRNWNKKVPSELQIAVQEIQIDSPKPTTPIEAPPPPEPKPNKEVTVPHQSPPKISFESLKTKLLHTPAAKSKLQPPHRVEQKFHPPPRIEPKPAPIAPRLAIKHGTVTGTFRDGTRSFEIEYVRGIKHGRESHWYNNGQLHFKGTNHWGQRSGPWNFRDSHGVRTKTLVYSSDGKLKSETYYFKNGVSREEIQRDATGSIAKRIVYDIHGRINRLYVYQNGKQRPTDASELLSFRLRPKPFETKENHSPLPVVDYEKMVYERLLEEEMVRDREK